MALGLGLGAGSCGPGFGVGASLSASATIGLFSLSLISLCNLPSQDTNTSFLLNLLFSLRKSFKVKNQISVVAVETKHQSKIVVVHFNFGSKKREKLSSKR